LDLFCDGIEARAVDESVQSTGSRWGAHACMRIRNADQQHIVR
jgi:hypothetical protein